MNYPLISEYVEAIKAAEDNFKKLTNLRPILGEKGQSVKGLVVPKDINKSKEWRAKLSIEYR